MVREATGGLMDEAPSSAVVDRLKTVISSHAAGALEAHDVRVRAAGRVTFIDLHLVVPGDMRVAEAHGICDRIEEARSGPRSAARRSSPSMSSRRTRQSTRGSWSCEPDY